MKAEVDAFHATQTCPAHDDPHARLASMDEEGIAAEMIFPVARLISDLSQGTTLLAGTAIVTGTPSGVGMARKPPVWLKDGDVVEVEIDRLGILRNTVRVE